MAAGALCAAFGITMGLAGERFWGGEWSGLVIAGTIAAAVLWAVAIWLDSGSESRQ
jgi:hypothetical protein